MTAMLDAALAYAARGWPVFPCKPGGKAPAIPSAHPGGETSCKGECGRDGHGFHDATTDPDRIRAWWADNPDANIGIATGAPGPDVIDFDTDDDTWRAALHTLTGAGILESCGWLVRTRSGGIHAYFAGTAQRCANLRPAFPVDFKAAGGYVLGPESRVGAIDGKPGGTYERISQGAPDPAEADWRIVRDLVIPQPPFQQPAAEKAALSAHLGLPGAAFAATVTWPEILSEYGWRQVRQVGSNIRYWCRPNKAGRGTSASTRDDGGLWVFSSSTDFKQDTLYTKFGAWALLHGYGEDYKAAAAQLRKDGYGAQAAAASFAQPTPAAVPSGNEAAASGPQGDAEAEWWAPIAARHTPIDWQQLFDDTPEEEDWIIEPLLAAGRSIAIYSPPKAGKSLITLEVAAALAAGRPVLGQPAGEPRSILYVDLENGRRDIRDRIVSLGYKPADLDRLTYLSFPTLPSLDSAPGGREITGLAIAWKADVVIIDTVSRVISGAENDADTFAALYRHALAPLKAMGVAVIRLDHAGKDLGKGQRGSSAKNADVDAVWTLTAAGPVITLRCEMSRSPLDTPVLTLRRRSGPLRHEVSGYPAGDKEQATMAKLAELEIPADWGYDRCRDRLRAAGFTVDTNVLKRVIAARKAAPDLSDDLDGADGTPDRSQPAATRLAASQTGNRETGGSNPSATLQTGSDTHVQGDFAEPVWSGGLSQRGPAQTGAGAPAETAPGVCSNCGERLPHEGRPCQDPGPAAAAAS